MNVALAGDYAYVASSSSGLHVVDISDPSNPNGVGFYDTQGEAFGVAVAGNLARGLTRVLVLGEGNSPRGRRLGAECTGWSGRKTGLGRTAFGMAFGK